MSSSAKASCRMDHHLLCILRCAHLVDCCYFPTNAIVGQRLDEHGSWRPLPGNSHPPKLLLALQVMLHTFTKMNLHRLA